MLLRAAPWKDDADTLTEEATARLFWTYPRIGLRADNGACAVLGRIPGLRRRQAFAVILGELRTHPDAQLRKLVSPTQPTVSVREFAEDEAKQISGCFSRVTTPAAGWDALRRRLDGAIAASR